MSALHISLAAEPVFAIGSWVITNSVLTSFVASVLTAAILLWTAKRVSLHPASGLAHAIEAIMDALLNLFESVTHNRTKALGFFPLLATIFLFVLLNNWLGLLPGVGSIVSHTAEGTVPLFRAGTADLNTTIALAIISVVMTQVYAVRALGLFKHLRKYFSPNPILLFVGLLEIVSEFSKMVSFSFRLFGNVFAGEVLLAVIAYLAPLAAPLPFFILEIFVGFIQALVFTMLSLVFLEGATVDHSGEAGHTASSDHPPLPKSGVVLVEAAPKVS